MKCELKHMQRDVIKTAENCKTKMVFLYIFIFISTNIILKHFNFNNFVLVSLVVVLLLFWYSCNWLICNVDN